MTLPPRLVIVVGTYDGVLGGWERQIDGSMKLTLATSVHEGSIRALCFAASHTPDSPGTLLSSGYDEMLRTHDWSKHLNSSGEVRTPADFGTPICSSFAPPTVAPSTHCMVGFSGGKIGLYKKRDWSVQHILGGHDGGVASLGVHPSGKLALSGGQSDGKLKLWDLTKGRLAYVTKLTPSSAGGGVSRFDPVVSIVWTKDGNAFAWAYGNHVTVRDCATGKDLLDVEVPGKINEITLMEGPDGIFVAAACNDGSLPVLAVSDVDDDDETRRACLAIEPVDTLVAGEERFKCISAIGHGYHVITANSSGVISIMDLRGAVNMMLTSEDEPEQEEKDSADENVVEDDNDDNTDDVELAVDIITSLQLGTGARVTCLSAWCFDTLLEDDEQIDETVEELTESEPCAETVVKHDRGLKRPVEVEMDGPAIDKARDLVKQAKVLAKKKAKRRKKSKQG